MTSRSERDAHDDEGAARQRVLVVIRPVSEEAERRVRLPVLDNIRVAAPCTADWNKMEGGERVRACGDCNKNVYNLSGMTREEAEALIVAKEGRLCVRYYRRADGTILFSDCTIGVSRRRRRRLVAGAAALLAATGGVAYEVSRAAEQEIEEDTREVVGAIAIPNEALRDPLYERKLLEMKLRAERAAREERAARAARASQAVMGEVSFEPRVPAVKRGKVPAPRAPKSSRAR